MGVKNLGTKAGLLVGALKFKSQNFTTTVKGVVTSTVELDPGSIASVTRGTVTGTVTGARAGDVVIAQPPATLNDDLIYCGAAVTADDTVTVYLYNPTGGAIDDGALNWVITVIDVT